MNDDSSSTFYTNVFFSLEKYLESTEKVTCIGGTPSLVFIGTSQGNIHLIKHEKEEYKVLQSNNLSKAAPVEQAIFASALNAVFFVCGKSLIEIDVETFSVQFMRDKVSKICLNSDPTHDDPFTLQLALICDKQIHICDKKNDRLDVKHRIHADSRIVTCEYSRNIICYATENEYRMYDRKKRVTLPLFPIELSQLTPAITTVGTEEFILTGMDGLLIFVNGTGMSTNAPIMMHVNLTGIFFKHPFIFGQGADSMSALDMTSSSRNNMEQIALPNLSSAALLDGVLFVSSGKTIATVNQHSIDDQIEQLFTSEKYDQINDMLETMLRNDFSEERLLESYAVRSRIGFKLLESGQFEKAAEIFTDAQTAPTEILKLFKVGCEDASDDSTLYDSNEHRSFLKEFLLDIRGMEYSQAYKQKIDFVLLKLCATEGKLDDLVNLPDFNAIENGPKFLQSIGMHNKAAEMLYKHGNLREALEIWKKLAIDDLQDPEFQFTDLQTRLMEISSKEILTEALRWFSTCGEMTLEIINARYNETVDTEIVGILEGLPQLEDYLESRNLNGWAMEKLAEIYFQKINDGDETCRSKMRELLIQMPHEILSQVDVSKYKSDTFQLEKIIINSEKNPEKEIQKLLKKYKEVELAEKLCSRYAATHPQLGMSLLTEYLQAERHDSKSLARIGRLLGSLAPFVNVKDIMNKIPNDMHVQELSSFLLSSVQQRENYRNQLQIKGVLLANVVPEEKRESKPVVISENYCCKVCQLPIALDQQLLHLPTGYVIHAKCIRHPNLCPVTNTLFST